MVRRLIVAALGGRHITIHGAEHRHARAFRLRTGDEVELLERGSGRKVLARVEHCDRQSTGLEVTGNIEGLVHECSAMTRGIITIVAAMPSRPRRCDVMVEKLTELGVEHLVPLCTERGSVYSQRSERWRAVVEAALKQCGRPAPLVIHEPASLGDLPRVARELRQQSEGSRHCSTRPRVTMPVDEVWLHASATGPPVRSVLSCWTNGMSPTSAAMDQSSESDRNGIERDVPLGEGGRYRHVVVCVGPEGGFTAREEEDLECMHAMRVSLGPYILRTETACMTAAAVVGGWLDEGVQ